MTTMLAQPSCGVWRSHSYALALGMVAFVAEPITFQLFARCPVAQEAAVVVPCAPVSEEPHTTEGHPGQGAFNTVQVSARTTRF